MSEEKKESAPEIKKPVEKKEPETSFDKIIDSLTAQNKALQEQLGRKEASQEALKEHSLKLEEIVRKLGELKTAPVVAPQETLLDAIERVLGWKD